MRQQLEEYLAQRTAEGLSAVSIKDYRDRLERFLAYLGAVGVRSWPEVTVQHIDGFMSSTKTLSANWRGALLAAAKGFLCRMHEAGKILTDPARHVELPRPDADDLPLPEPPLEEADIARIFALLPRRCVRDLRNTALVEVLYSAGLRLSEALSLNVGDIDFDGGVLIVRRGKGGHSREVPILRGLRGTLRDYLSLRRSLLKGPDTGVLFLDRNGRRWTMNSVRFFFKRLNRLLAGKVRHVHPHLFRHSIAVHLLRGGADIRYVQSFLGHALLDTTKVYLRLVPADLRKAYDAAMPEMVLDAGVTTLRRAEPDVANAKDSNGEG
jgi:integrase/recombinase XerD